VPVGVDVVATARVARDIEQWGDTFIARVLTPAEQAWCEAAADRATAVAACVAAKEAVVKVLGGRPRGFTWTGVELIPDGGAGRQGECRALVRDAAAGAADSLVVGLWRCALDSVLGWSNGRVEAAAVTRGPHVIAVAAA